MISHEISTAGAFFFVTLFNLQGARRSAERCYYTGSSGRLSSLFSTFFADHFRSCETARLDYHIFMPFVKYFFQSLNFPLTSPRPLSRTALLEYQIIPRLSTPFFNFLRFFYFSLLRPLIPVLPLCILKSGCRFSPAAAHLKRYLYSIN